MIQIRPVSDLRNKFPDIEKAVGGGEPVYLTKNGYGAMVVLSLEAYSRLTDGVEVALDENNSITHDFVGKFGSASVMLKRSPEGTGITIRAAIYEQTAYHQSCQ